jgi:hypothetical protein
MTYTVTTLVNSTTIAGARVLRNVTHTLNSKQAALTGVIPHGSGAILTGDAPFVALTITDSNAVSAFGTDNSKGDKYVPLRTAFILPARWLFWCYAHWLTVRLLVHFRYDWGIPLLPRNELTSQVQIGLAYGCTNNRCDGTFRAESKRMAVVGTRD